jgi:hypothetical protein
MGWNNPLGARPFHLPSRLTQGPGKGPGAGAQWVPLWRLPAQDTGPAPLPPEWGWPVPRARGTRGSVI